MPSALFTMPEFYKNERVVVRGGDFSGSSGKVLNNSYENPFWLRHHCDVLLDSGETKTLMYIHLDHENFNSADISRLIKNIEKNFTKVSSNFPQKDRTEIPTHLGYLRNALLSNDFTEALREFNYLKSHSDDASKNGTLPEGWMKMNRTDFEKLDWAVKRLSR